MGRKSMYYPTETCKNLISILFVLLILVTLLWMGGCTPKIEQVAASHTVYYGDPIQPNPDAEFVLEGLFSASDVPWDKESLAVIEECRRSIVGAARYMKERLDINGNVPYYAYKESFEFTNYQYTKLQKELDARVQIEGALSLEGQVIYNYVKKDIKERLTRQQVKTAQEEDAINEIANKQSLEELKGIYNAIQPLIGGLI